MMTILKHNPVDTSIALIRGYASPLGVMIAKHLSEQGFLVLGFGKNLFFDENSNLNLKQNKSFFFSECSNQTLEEFEKHLKALCHSLSENGFRISLLVNIPFYEEIGHEDISQKNANIIDIPGLIGAHNQQSEKEYRVSFDEVLPVCEVVSEYMIQQNEGLILNIAPYQKPGAVGYQRQNDPLSDYSNQLDDELSQYHASAKMIYAADPKTTLNFPFRRSLSLKYSQYIRPFDERVVVSAFTLLMQAYYNRVEYAQPTQISQPSVGR